MRQGSFAFPMSRTLAIDNITQSAFSAIFVIMLLYIKNMVCHRCVLAVEHILRDLKIPYSSVFLGEVQLTAPISNEMTSKLADRLSQIGFTLIDDRKSRLIGKIKSSIIELVHHSSDQPRINLSEHLSDRLLSDYPYLSKLFSEIEGTTIEKYYIGQKIERVKELLVYDELSLSEIAFQLGYSSVAHLSSQFKKVTGLTPSHFKSIKSEKRKPLDKV